MRGHANELDAGRQAGQRSDRTTQNTHQPRPSTRPKQTQKRVIAAVSEALCKSTRAGPRKRAPEGSSERGLRPDSGAETFLVLEKDPSEMHRKTQRTPEPRPQARGMVSRTRGRQGADAYYHGVPPLVNPYLEPIVGISPDRPQTPVERTASLGVSRTARHRITHASAKRARNGDFSYAVRAVETPDRLRGDARRARVPENDVLNRDLSPGRAPRGYKALPALPQGASSQQTTFVVQTYHHSADAFQNNKGKVSHGRGSPILPNAPRMHTALRVSGSSSRSSCDSAEQTWNMIDKMMNAVDEEEIKNVRAALLRNKKINDSKAGWSTTLPHPVTSRSRKMNFPRSSSSSERDGRKDLNDIFQLSPLRVHGPSRSLTRCPSAASVFSIVIQPSGGHNPALGVSEEPPIAHVAEENLPTRIRRIMQERARYNTSPDFDATDLYELSHYHADLSMTLEILRDVGDGELEEIVFDKEDV